MFYNQNKEFIYMKALRSAGIPLIIVIVAIVVAVVLTLNKPKPEKKELVEKTFLVEVQPVSISDVTYTVTTQGNVMAKVESALSAQVSGRIEAVSDIFVNGGMFKKGDELVRLENADKITDVKLAQAEVSRAQASYEEELARGKVAEKEWRSINSTVAPELGLRKPQLAREKASLQAAKANLERAERNLDRTVIRAPYDGIVQQKNVDIGQFVNMGTVLANIAATDKAEVRLPLTDADLAYLNLDASKAGNVLLTGRVGGRTEQWLAKLTRDEGVINMQSRVIYAIAEVSDPYQRDPATQHKTLRFGSFVNAEITGASAENIVVLPRNLVRLDGTVITVTDEREILIKDVEVQRADDEKIYISAGLQAGDNIAVSAVPNAYDGMKVRLPGDEPSKTMTSTKEESE